ncbi:hypothetical protein [Phaeacidiphilus oryzae]|uniref:hypothetical protein n=1 Tax=Phaeacidiphilus oryzae TaxID=348818 RepID=UPI000562C9F6|nr:hypothetical protein [Phaeacidiphilus oryzae]
MTHLVGVRARWRTDSLGEFFCPGCGGDRRHRRQHGRRWLRLVGAPLLPLRTLDECVQCMTCRRRYPLEALERPTSARLTTLLRDAQYTVALAVLAAGGTTARAAREAACQVVREAGFEDHGEAQVLAALAALGGLGESAGAPDAADAGVEAAGAAGPGPDRFSGCGSELAVELHATLEPLAPHLAPQGLERLLLQGAWIALADGPYRPSERDTLTAVGCCLRMTAEQIDSTLEAAARMPHQH